MRLKPFLRHFSQPAGLSVAAVLFLLLLPVRSLACEPALDWQAEQEQAGVTIWRAEDSQQRTWIKAQTQAETPYWSLLNLLRDTANAPQWIDDVIQVVSLPGTDKYTDLVYTEFHAPWPFSDRKMSTQSTLRFFPGHQKMHIQVAQHPDFNDANHLVAMQDIEGCWSATQTSSTHTLITWAGTAKPGGILPDWLVRTTMKQSTMNTFQALKTQLAKKKYQEKPLAYPEVP